MNGAWLDLLMESGILKEEFVMELLREDEELLKMLSSMRKGLG